MRPCLAFAAAVALVLVAGCEEVGNLHEKPSDAPYAADPSPDPDPEPDPEPETEPSGRIDAYAHECLGITEVVYDIGGNQTTTKHIWENQCSYEVIVFYCQDSYTGPILDPPAVGTFFSDQRDCGTSGPGGNGTFYGPSQPFYNRSQHLHAVGSAYGSTWSVTVGQDYIGYRGHIKYDLTYRYAVCRADTEAYWRSYRPEITSDADGSYECWIPARSRG